MELPEEAIQAQVRIKAEPSRCSGEGQEMDSAQQLRRQIAFKKYNGL